eukprot:7910555-Heterocapsa_arctica.AAC.1
MCRNVLIALSAYRTLSQIKARLSDLLASRVVACVPLPLPEGTRDSASYMLVQASRGVACSGRSDQP